jgi:hypothetical protein
MIDRFRSDSGLEKMQKNLDSEQSIEEFQLDENGSAQKALLNSTRAFA